MRRLARWPHGLEPLGNGRGAERLPRVGREFLVLQFDGLRHRAAHVRREGHGLELLGTGQGELGTCLDSLCSWREGGSRASERVVLVSAEARPVLLSGPYLCAERAEAGDPVRGGRDDGGSEPLWSENLLRSGESLTEPRLHACLSHAVRARWAGELGARGLELAAVYPLAGSPLCALEEEPDSGLFVQVEHELIVLAELVRGRCVQLDLYPGDAPTPRHVQELVGEACPEVLLCGGGADLADLGYELARTGSTWVRLLHACAPRLAEPALAAIVGAARHACGLAPEHLQAFVR